MEIPVPQNTQTTFFIGILFITVKQLEKKQMFISKDTDNEIVTDPYARIFYPAAKNKQTTKRYNSTNKSQTHYVEQRKPDIK